MKHICPADAAWPAARSESPW